MTRLVGTFKELQQQAAAIPYFTIRPVAVRPGASGVIVDVPVRVTVSNGSFSVNVEPGPAVITPYLADNHPLEPLFILVPNTEEYTLGRALADYEAWAPHHLDVVTQLRDQMVDIEQRTRTNANNAAASATTASTKAREAAASAATASSKASEATTKAREAAASATTASQKAGEATTKAREAAASAATASQKASEAERHKNAAADSADTAGAAAARAESSKQGAQIMATQARDSARDAAIKANEAAASAERAESAANTGIADGAVAWSKLDAETQKKIDSHKHVIADISDLDISEEPKPLRVVKRGLQGEIKAAGWIEVDGGGLGGEMKVKQGSSNDQAEAKLVIWYEYARSSYSEVARQSYRRVALKLKNGDTVVELRSGGHGCDMMVNDETYATFEKFLKRKEFQIRDGVDLQLTGSRPTPDDNSVMPKRYIDTEMAKKANSSHTHAIANVTGLQDALNGKAASSHTHAIANVTGLQEALNGKVNTNDSRLTNARTPTAHTHTIANVTGLQDALNGKAASSHTHTIANVTGLQTALNGKVNTNDSRLTDARTPKAHTHTISQISDLQNQLNSKATKADITNVTRRGAGQWNTTTKTGYVIYTHKFLPLAQIEIIDANTSINNTYLPNGIRPIAPISISVAEAGGQFKAGVIKIGTDGKIRASLPAGGFHGGRTFGLA